MPSRCREYEEETPDEGEAVENEDRGATPDLLLKHSDATLATYI